MITSDICFEKICKIRKEMQEITPPILQLDEINPHVLYQLSIMLNSYGLLLMKEILDIHVEQLDVPYKYSNVCVPRRQISVTVSYSVVDIDSHDVFGPFHVASNDIITEDDNSIQFAKERNEWIARTYHNGDALF